MSRRAFRVAAAALATRSARIALCFVLLAFCAAPVPGDVGGCNQPAQQLDPVAFFSSKQDVDCQRCSECGLASRNCDRACAAAAVAVEFSDGCVPLVHDGEVCLRALLAASCGTFQSYVRDDGPTTPTECDFCPRRAQ